MQRNSINHMPRLSTTRSASSQLQFPMTEAHKYSQHMSVMALISWATASWQSGLWWPPGSYFKGWSLSLLPAWTKLKIYFAMHFSRNNSEVHILVQAHVPCTWLSTDEKQSEQQGLKNQQWLFIQLCFFQQDRKYHLFKYLEWMAHLHELRLGSLFTPDRGFPLNLCYMKQERVCRVHMDHHWNVSSTGAQRFTLKHL